MRYPQTLDIARSLVRIPSVNPAYDPVSPGERDAVAWIARWASERKIAASIQNVTGDRANVLLTLRNESDHPHLLFNGHTDTVSVEGMTIAPFGGETVDGRLHGRGATDMKGPLACMLAAMEELSRSREGWRGTITVAAVVDEEFRFLGIRRYLQDHPRVDFAIVGEPTRLEIVRGCKGCLRFAVSTHGRAAHSSRPSEGASAIVAMTRVVVDLEEFFARRLTTLADDDFGSSTGSIGLIRGGTGVNIVPDLCQIEVDVRLLPGQDGQATLKEIETHLARTSLPAGTSVSVGAAMLIDPAFVLPRDDPFVGQLKRALGRDQAPVAMFSCDASKIAAAGIPCVVLGPGDIRSAHTADESIALADLDAGTDAYLRIARSLLARS